MRDRKGLSVALGRVRVGHVEEFFFGQEVAAADTMSVDVGDVQRYA
jgi:hypothetical protein